MLSTMPVDLGANQVKILGYSISTLSMEATVAQLLAWIEQREPRLVVTVDATALVIAHDDPSFSETLGKASLLTADSVGILWAMKRKGLAGVEKVSGVDLVAKLCEKSAETGLRLYFLGSEPGVTEQAAERLRLRFPGVHIVGTHHGYFPADSDNVVAEEIAQCKPDVLFVAMGMPRQEQFILNTQSIIAAPLALGVGGSFDVYSGRTKRAPKLFQVLRLEWLWRLALNPKKISKVKLLPRFVALILRHDG